MICSAALAVLAAPLLLPTVLHLPAAQQDAARAGAPDETIAPVRAGEPFPDRVLEDLQGKPRALHELAGKRVVMPVWASW